MVVIQDTKHVRPKGRQYEIMTICKDPKKSTDNIYFKSKREGAATLSWVRHEGLQAEVQLSGDFRDELRRSWKREELYEQRSKGDHVS